MRTRYLIVGAGFAGAATAWALARRRLGPGIILEREFSYGAHASGRNAGLVRLAEEDPLIRALAVRSLEALGRVSVDGHAVLRQTGALTLARRAEAADVDHRRNGLRDCGIDANVLPRADAIARFPLLRTFEFDLALWTPQEGVVDIHALLGYYLDEARRGGFALRTHAAAEGLIVESGRAVGVRTNSGDVYAEVIVDASGAWAGRIGRASRLPLRPFRRHLCTTGGAAGWERDSPYVWMWSNELYCRPELDGLLMSPCDVTPAEPETLTDDPGIGDLLASRLAHHAPGLLELPLRRTWACLRTFAPDHRPIIGADPDLPGLFHVSGLGGFGMMTSPAVGEAAAAAIAGDTLDWIDLRDVSAARF